MARNKPTVSAQERENLIRLLMLLEAAVVGCEDRQSHQVADCCLYLREVLLEWRP